MIDLCSAFFSIPVNEASQYIFAFAWTEKEFTWTIMPQGFTKDPFLFLTNPDANLDCINFPRSSTLLQYADNLLLCSSSQAFTQGNIIHLFGAFGLEGTQKSPKESCSFVQIQIQYLEHLISEERLHPYLDRIHGHVENIFTVYSKR